jgi:hypothetical protein
VQSGTQASEPKSSVRGSSLMRSGSRECRVALRQVNLTLLNKEDGVYHARGQDRALSCLQASQSYVFIVQWYANLHTTVPVHP